MHRFWKITGWIGLILIALVFIQAGVLKLVGEQMTVEGFNNLGFPVWFRFAIGIIEVVGGIALLIRNYSRYSAVLLAAVMIGGIVTTLMSGQIVEAMIPLVVFCIMVWIAVVRKPVNLHQSNNQTLA